MKIVKLLLLLISIVAYSAAMRKPLKNTKKKDGPLSKPKKPPVEIPSKGSTDDLDDNGPFGPHIEHIEESPAKPKHKHLADVPPILNSVIMSPDRQCDLIFPIYAACEKYGREKAHEITFHWFVKDEDETDWKDKDLGFDYLMYSTNNLEWKDIKSLLDASIGTVGFKTKPLVYYTQSPVKENQAYLKGLSENVEQNPNDKGYTDAAENVVGVVDKAAKAATKTKDIQSAKEVRISGMQAGVGLIGGAAKGLIMGGLERKMVSDAAKPIASSKEKDRAYCRGSSNRDQRKNCT